MILDDAALLKIITERPHKKLIEAAQKYTRKLLMHVKGIDLDKYIEKITAFEKQDIVAVRKRYAVSNKAMFSRINRPTDKVFSAKGGSCYYNLGEGLTAKMKAYVSNLVDGYTLKQWLKVFWMPAVGYDPMGVIMMEIDEAGLPYPTYKSIMDIFEYKLKGRDLEYIIFKLPQRSLPVITNTENGEPTQQNKGDQKLQDAVAAGEGTPQDLYRVVDDVSDRIVKISSDKVTEVPGETYPNYWMKVPASIISNIYDPVLSMFISSEDQIIELADQFLREGSVKNIIMNYHGFPKAWEYQSSCPGCGGTKVQGGQMCPDCKGSGVKSKSYPEDTIRVPVPQSTDQPKIAPDLGGFITPPIEGINLFKDELEWLEDLMFETKWGTHMADDTKGGEKETATGKYIDLAPINDKLNEFSDAAEMMETFITDRIGEILFTKAYKGASVTYGRRFLMETPDMIWEKLTKSIVSGAPTAALADLYNDYLQARYSANAMEMQKMMKLAKVEPLPWVKYVDFGRLQTFPDIILRRKYWFEPWMNSKTDPFILMTDIPTLQADFTQFCKDNDTILNEDVQKNSALDVSATPPVPEPAPGDTAPAPGKKPIKITA